MHLSVSNNLDHFDIFTDDSFHRFCPPFNERYHLGTTSSFLRKLPSTSRRSQRGYYIPAGTTVTGNLWYVGVLPCILLKTRITEAHRKTRAISRDPVAFPDPEKFDPQRWLDQNGQLRDDVKCYPFGFGRRYVYPLIVHISSAELMQ